MLHKNTFDLLTFLQYYTTMHRETSHGKQILLHLALAVTATWSSTAE